MSTQNIQINGNLFVKADNNCDVKLDVCQPLPVNSGVEMHPTS